MLARTIAGEAGVLFHTSGSEFEEVGAILGWQLLGFGEGP